MLSKDNSKTNYDQLVMSESVALLRLPKDGAMGCCGGQLST